MFNNSENNLYNDREQVSAYGVYSPVNVGVGYIFIPVDMDREVYIADALKRQQLALMSNYSRIDNVKIPQHLINQIEFPITHKELGSYILYVIVPKFNQAVAVAILNKDSETNNIKENEFRIIKNDSNTEVAFLIGSKDGIVMIKGNSSKKTKLTLDFKGTESLIELICDNTISSECKDYLNRTFNSIKFIIKNNQTDADLETTIDYINGEGFSYKDEFDTEIKHTKDGTTYKDQFDNEIILDKDNIQLISKKINFGEGLEKVVKGDSLNTNLETLITTLQTLVTAINTVATTDATIATGLGLTYGTALSASLPSILTQLTTLNINLKNHLSNKVNTD